MEGNGPMMIALDQLPKHLQWQILVTTGSTEQAHQALAEMSEMVERASEIRRQHDMMLADRNAQKHDCEDVEPIRAERTDKGVARKGDAKSETEEPKVETPEAPTAETSAQVAPKATVKTAAK